MREHGQGAEWGPLGRVGELINRKREGCIERDSDDLKWDTDHWSEMAFFRFLLDKINLGNIQFSFSQRPHSFSSGICCFKCHIQAHPSLSHQPLHYFWHDIGKGSLVWLSFHLYRDSLRILNASKGCGRNRLKLVAKTYVPSLSIDTKLSAFFTVSGAARVRISDTVKIRFIFSKL